MGVRGPGVGVFGLPILSHERSVFMFSETNTKVCVLIYQLHEQLLFSPAGISAGIYRGAKVSYLEGKNAKT